MLRRPADYLFLFIKGLCIGATGVLHGISGGSMALLLGIHQEFVLSLRAIDRKSFQLLKQKKISEWWSRIHGNFLLILLTGIITGILTLRSLFSDLIQAYPIYVSSFFFCLVFIAALLLLRKITRWNVLLVVIILAGVAISYFITRLPPLHTPNQPLLALFGGMLAGSTFILPGVSGAFILIFIGKYHYILTSFGSLEADVITLFIAGAVLGIAVIVRMVAALLIRFFNSTVALFAGLMIGSLNKIWPWREVYEYATTLQGRRIPAFDKSILPWRYMELTGKDPQVFYAILMMALGVFMVVLIEKIAEKLKTKS